MRNLGPRIGNAFVAQGTTALLGKLTTLILTIALARILVPADFGLFTLALVITGLANTLSNFGFQSYLIQAEEPRDEEVDACFTLNILLSLALGIVVAAVGWLWRDPPPLLPEMLQMYGLQVLVSGFSYVPLAMLKRNLDFRRSSRAELANAVFASCGRVTFALLGAGPLCFPLGDVLGALVCWHLASRSSGRRPQLVMPRRRTAGDAIRFGAHSTSTGVASFFANQSDKMLLAWSFPVQAIGLYGFASNTAGVFYRSIMVPQSAVFLASFSRLRHTDQDIRGFLHRSARIIYSLSLAVCGLLILDSERIVALVFGEQWRLAAGLVGVFAISYLIRSMFPGITGLQLSFGLAGAAARTKWINAIAFTAILAAAAATRPTLHAYALAYLFADIVTILHNVVVNGRLVGLVVWSHLRNLVAPTMVAAGSAVAWWGADRITTGVPEAAAVLLCALTWAAAYLLFSLYCNRVVATAVIDRFAARARSGRSKGESYSR